MSGILDNKTRILDSIITFQGRKQMSTGGLKVAYVSFSDSDTFYESDIVSGSSDATNRLYLEASNLPQDMITFEADDSGKLLPFPISPGSLSSEIKLISGQLLEPSGSSYMTYTTMTDSSFSSQSENLIKSSLDNFKNCYIIGSKDSLLDIDDTNRFGLSTNTETCQITNKIPFNNDYSKQTVNINDLESIFFDQRFSRLPNFKYLPPIKSLSTNKLTSEQAREHSKNEDCINKKLVSKHISKRSLPIWKNNSAKLKKTIDDSIYDETHLLGYYKPLKSIETLSDKSVLNGLKVFEKFGYKINISFIPKPLENNICCQIFEQKNGMLLKLDILDFGEVSLNDDQIGNVYFIGKVITDENKLNTFIHMFTMIFESNSLIKKLNNHR